MPKDAAGAGCAQTLRATNGAKRGGGRPLRAAVGEAKARETDHVLRLPAVLDLAAAAPLAEALSARRGQPATVDASGVESPATPCLQVLLSAIRTWASDGVPLEFVHCGPSFVETLRLLGVDEAPFAEGVRS
jgi:chemotaxis protein CheX